MRHINESERWYTIRSMDYNSICPIFLIHMNQTSCAKLRYKHCENPPIIGRIF